MQLLVRKEGELMFIEGREKGRKSLTLCLANGMPVPLIMAHSLCLYYFIVMFQCKNSTIKRTEKSKKACSMILKAGKIFEKQW